MQPFTHGGPVVAGSICCAEQHQPSPHRVQLGQDSLYSILLIMKFSEIATTPRQEQPADADQQNSHDGLHTDPTQTQLSEQNSLGMHAVCVL
jgi:hypothetical protein